MSYTEFEESITSPDLKTLARHWNDARGSKAMPAWPDIKPGKISSVLPIVWAYTYDAQTEAFTGRIAGDRIVETFGKSFRGLPLEAIQPPEAFPWVYQLLRRVVVETKAYHGAGRVFQQLDRYGWGERMALPLGGTHGDGVLGATEYHRAGFAPGVSAGPFGESESWFSLVP